MEQDTRTGRADGRKFGRRKAISRYIHVMETNGSSFRLDASRVLASGMDNAAALGRLLVLALTFAGTAMAQEQPKELPDAPVAKQDSVPLKHENHLQSTIAILGRRSLFFPDLAATKGSLTTKQKLELFAGDSIAPYHLLSSGIGAGITQARNSLPGYGQGMSGYGKRFGSSIATSTTSSFFGKFLLASWLRYDPRYFVMLQGGPGRRIEYALSRIVVARTDAGTRAANWPGAVSPLLAESLANSYLPAREQTAGKTFQRYGVRIGLAGAANVAREYWPTIFRDLRLSKIAPGMNSDPTLRAPKPPGAPHVCCNKW